MEFNKSCKTLSIYSFDRIIDTSDMRFLMKTYDEYEDEVNLTMDEQLVASEIFKDILYEYSELTFDRNILQNYNSQIYIEKEMFKYDNTIKVLEIYAINEDVEVLDILIKLGFNFNKEGNIEEQIKAIVTSMKKLKTKIGVLKLKYTEKFNKKNKENNVQSVSLDSQCVHLETSLKLSYQINTKLTSVSKWISMFDVANKINAPKN